MWSMRADSTICAKTPWDSKEKKKDGWMGPKIRERRGRKCEWEQDRAWESQNRLTVERWERETESLGGSGCEKQEEMTDWWRCIVIKKKKRQSAAARQRPRMNYLPGLACQPVYATHSLTLAGLHHSILTKTHTHTHIYGAHRHALIHTHGVNRYNWLRCYCFLSAAIVHFLCQLIFCWL